MIAKNPYQRAAALCALLGAVATVAVNSILGLPFLAAGLIFAVIAYGRRGGYPR